MFICDQCSSKDTFSKDFEYFFKVNNEEYSVLGKKRYCKNCNSDVYDRELDNDILKKALRKKEEILGIEPERIIRLRKEYNLSQDDFSKIIGCAKKTLISYEKGSSIPNDIYLIAIKMLLDNPQNIKILLNSNKERFNDKEYNRINSKLNIFDYEETKLSNYNGYTSFNFNKMKNVIKYLTKNGMLKTKLLKELFYIDFIYFKNNTVSLTGSEYKKYPYGPVPSNYENILNELVKMNEIEISYSTNGNYEFFNIISKNEIIELESDEKELVDNVRQFFDKFSVNDIVQYSHKEEAYINTQDYELVDYNYSENINIE